MSFGLLGRRAYGVPVVDDRGNPCFAVPVLAPSDRQIRNGCMEHGSQYHNMGMMIKAWDWRDICRTLGPRIQGGWDWPDSSGDYSRDGSKHVIRWSTGPPSPGTGEKLKEEGATGINPREIGRYWRASYIHWLAVQSVVWRSVLECPLQTRFRL